MEGSPSHAASRNELYADTLTIFNAVAHVLLMRCVIYAITLKLNTKKMDKMKEKVVESISNNPEHMTAKASTFLLDAIYNFEILNSKRGDPHLLQMAQIEFNRAEVVYRGVTDITEGNDVAHADMMILAAWIHSTVEVGG